MPHPNRLKRLTPDQQRFLIGSHDIESPHEDFHQLFERSPKDLHSPIPPYYKAAIEDSYFCTSNNRHHPLRATVSGAVPLLIKRDLDEVNRRHRPGQRDCQCAGFADGEGGGFNSSGGGFHSCNRSSKGRASGVDSRVGSLGGCSHVSSKNPCSSKVCRMT